MATPDQRESNGGEEIVWPSFLNGILEAWPTSHKKTGFL